MDLRAGDAVKILYIGGPDCPADEQGWSFLEALDSGKKSWHPSQRIAALSESAHAVSSDALDSRGISPHSANSERCRLKRTLTALAIRNRHEDREGYLSVIFGRVIEVLYLSEGTNGDDWCYGTPLCSLSGEEKQEEQHSGWVRGSDLVTVRP